MLDIANDIRCLSDFTPGVSLRDFWEGRLDCRGNVDGGETIDGEQVVLATLVDDAKVAIPLGVPVRKDDVDLVPLDHQAAACPSRRGSSPADNTFVRGYTMIPLSMPNMSFGSSRR